MIWDKSGTNFSHWPNQAAEWMGPYETITKTYEYIDYANIQRSVEVNKNIIKRYAQYNSTFAAFEPVNEPWENSNFDILKAFYRANKENLNTFSPDTTFVFHNAFTFEPEVWNDLFDDFTNVVQDHHYYQAWDGPDSNTTTQFCDQYKGISELAKTFSMDIWIGEWSLATDVCAMWLGGFNDGNTIPQQNCQVVECPKPYIDIPDLDRNKDMLGPFGTMDPKYVNVHNGNCFIDAAFFTDFQVNEIAKCALGAWSGNIKGHFLWTAHNELEEKWDYIKAYDKGWLNKNAIFPPENVEDEVPLYFLN